MLLIRRLFPKPALNISLGSGFLNGKDLPGRGTRGRQIPREGTEKALNDLKNKKLSASLAVMDLDIALLRWRRDG
jgi:hypothetical protein